MRFTILLFLLIIPGLGIGYSQPDSIFIKDDKIFINRYQPLYMWVSATPDVSYAIRLEGVQNNKYTNPFFLDTKGWNSIYPHLRVRLDIDGRTSFSNRHVYPVYCDGLPPVTSYRLLSASAVFRQGKRFYRTGLKLRLSAIDGMSGVAHTYYKINDSEFQKYTDDIFFDESGSYTVLFYSVDLVGNEENPKKIILNIL